MSDVKIFPGDVLVELRKMPSKSVHCIVTSPPYPGLRDYGIPPSIWGGRPKCFHVFEDDSVKDTNHSIGNHSTLAGIQPDVSRPKQINNGAFCYRCGAWRGVHGLEPSIKLYVKHSTLIFREARRVLRDDGVLFVNMGDAYNTAGTRQGNKSGGLGDREDTHNTGYRAARSEYKPKDLMGAPWRVALALQADGWTLRSDIIWFKPNPMPGSQQDRPTTAHEYVFLFSKQERYFWDAEAVKVKASTNTHARSIKPQGWHSSPDYHNTTPGHIRAPGVTPKAKSAGHHSDRRHKNNESYSAALVDVVPTRNIRTVWEAPEDEMEQFIQWGWEAFQAQKDLAAGSQTDVWKIGTEGYAGAHFATFPTALVRQCLLAGTSAKGCCVKCGAPWARVLEPAAPKLMPDEYAGKNGSTDKQHSGRRILANVQAARKAGGDHDNPFPPKKTIGWAPTCACDGIDRRIIATPVGASDLQSNPADLTLQEGRAGMGRERDDGEAVRLITRHEQQCYARQLRIARVDDFRVMQAEAGIEAMNHYMRTDDAGARPVPDHLLESWLAKEWLIRVVVPPVEDVPVKPCVAMDIFGGSGTTAQVARELGRDCFIIEIGAHHIPQIEARINTTPGLPGME